MFDLIEKINCFYKYAGQLQIPPKLTSQIIEWATACMAFELGERIKNLLIENKNRTASLSNLEAAQEEWWGLFPLIEEICSNSSNKHYLTSILDDIVEKTKRSNGKRATLPFFSIEETPLKLKGSVKSVRNSIMFSLSKEGDKYDVFIYVFAKVISFDENGVADMNKIEDLYIDESINDVSADEVVEVIKKAFPYLEKTYKAFDHFVNYDFEVFSNSYVKILQFLLGKCKRIYGNKELGNKSFGRYRKKFDIDLSDFPYMKNNSVEPKNQYIGCEFYFLREKYELVSKNSVGYWQKFEASTEIDANCIGTIALLKDTDEVFEAARVDSNGLESEINSLADVVKHEVRHFVQTFLGRLNKKNDLGLPSRKIIDNNYDMDGRPVYQGPIKNDVIDEEERNLKIKHPLRDVEFYTRLSDCIESFKQDSKSLPVSLHHDFALAYIVNTNVDEFKNKLKKEFMARKQNKSQFINIDAGYYVDRIMERIYNVSYFFRMLKEHQPLKYRKAVAEFMKAVE